MNSNIDNRQMPVFISSTFQDMQEERDCLMKRVFPKLKELAAHRMVTLTPIDLRWGVTQEESKSGKVVELCLHEIDRCRPFFIGLLGDRYGWCPGPDDFADNNMLTDQYQWLKHDLENGLSLTEIEMQYAVLRRQDHGIALFFIKSAEQGTTRDIRIQKLTDCIMSKGASLDDLTEGSVNTSLSQRCFYSYYNTQEDLAHKVEHAFTTLFQLLFPEVDGNDEWSRERAAQQAYLHEMTDVYVPTINNEFTSNCLDRMTDRYEMISSDKKCYYGKSAFVANWIRERQKKNSCDIVYHFIGVGYLGGNYKKILMRLYLEVAALLGVAVPKVDDLAYDQDYGPMLSQLLLNTEIRKPLYIIIDGLQHLSDYDESKMLNWFPSIPENVCMVVTAPDHDTSYEAFRRRYGPVFTLSQFEREEEALFIDRYLQKFGKRLSQAQSDQIISAFATAEFPPAGEKNILTLKSLLNELVVFGSFEQLDSRIDYYCEDRLSRFFTRMLHRWENDFDAETVRLVLCLIVYSRAGLSETEILDITKATPSQWSAIYYAISHLLTLSNGKYRIDKDTVAKAIIKRYHAYEEYTRRKLIRYFKDSEDNSSVVECLFQYYKLEDYDSLYDTIIKPNVFAHLFESSGVAELLPYWKALQTACEGQKYPIMGYAEQEIPSEEKSARILVEIAQFARYVIGDEEASKAILMKSKGILESVDHEDFRTAASVYSKLEEYDKALEYIDKAIRQAGLSDTEVPETLHGLELMSEKGSILFKMGMARQALELWKRTFDITVQTTGELSTPVLEACRNLASAYQVLGNDDCCKEYIERMMSIVKKTVGEEHVLMGDALFLYGIYHEEVGHKVEALNYYRKALTLYQRWYSDAHLQVVETKKAVERTKRSLPQSELLCIVDFYEGIADDLYLVNEGREDGMPEYEYRFRYNHDCDIEKDRYTYGPYSRHIYIGVDQSGRYISCGKALDTLRDAQVDYLVNLCTFYEEYCVYKNSEK